MSLATAAMNRPSASRSPAVTFHPSKTAPSQTTSRRSRSSTQNPPFAVPTITSHPRDSRLGSLSARQDCLPFNRAARPASRPRRQRRNGFAGRGKASPHFSRPGPPTQMVPAQRVPRETQCRIPPRPCSSTATAASATQPCAGREAGPPRTLRLRPWPPKPPAGGRVQRPGLQLHSCPTPSCSPTGAAPQASDRRRCSHAACAPLAGPLSRLTCPPPAGRRLRCLSRAPPSWFGRADACEVPAAQPRGPLSSTRTNA